MDDYVKCLSIVLTTSVFCMLVSCGQQDTVSPESTSSMTLVVVDSLGVAYGDTTQMYGRISGACFLSPDRFVVMDNAMEVVHLYSDQGVLLDSYHYHGSGPLEVMYGGYLAPFENGLAVFDEWLPRCVLLDSTMTPVREIAFDETMSLFESSLLNDTSVVSCIYSSRQNDDVMEFGVEVCRWSRSGERESEYYSEHYPMGGSVEDFYENYIKTEFSVATTRSGRIFIAPDGSGFQILSYTADESSSDTLFIEHQRERRSELEIQLELEFRRERDRSIGSWSPSNLEPGITQLQVQDSLGRLWICHGAYLDPEFDVLSLDGELLFTVDCEGLPPDEFVRFGITDNGYIAYTINPLEYPKLYLMELVEQ